MSTILQTQILVNLFLVLGFSLVSHTATLNPTTERAIRIVEFYGTALGPGKFDSDCGPLHSVLIMPYFDSKVNP